MKIIHALEIFEAGDTPVFLAAGCFDGLHVGHRAVIQVAIERARACGGEAWVFTFDPHPAKVLDPDHAPPLIYSIEQQLRNLKLMGVDGCILEPFTREFMQQEPAEFLDSLCRHIPTLAGISVGEDWSFGKNRSGTAETLKQFCEDQDMSFSAMQAVCWKGHRVSSTRIRAAIKLGHLEDAHEMLGHPVTIAGHVVHGEKIGQRLGYPTANIDPENEILPPRGIYAAHLRSGNHSYKAAAYIGHRGTFHENRPQVLEVHLIDQHDIDLYGQLVVVTFVEYIRGDRVFEDAGKLKEQIHADLGNIRAILA
ncbi:MAG: riboflavin biosynthesis protein RibF [Kiritimatiellales bacterium]|nr:riboflavin biosynthesis protein RibF [Kiritimatiellales bacterium]